MEIKKYTHQEWINRGRELFGENIKRWKFVCPICRNVASGEDFFKLGIDFNFAYQHCIGRHQANSYSAMELKEGLKPCDYAAYGLFQLAPVRVLINGEWEHAFAFEGDD